jgi:penicillin-binding protein 2
MRPRRSIVDRVVPGEPSPARTVVRLRVLGVLVVAVFSLMFVRLWYLQVLGSKGFAQAVTQNQVREVEVPAPRGLIRDRSGNVMVGNQVTEDITLSRLSAEQHPEVVGRLAALLGVTPAQIQADLSNTQYSLYKPVPVLENAPISDVLYIGEHSTQFPGVSATADTTRTYPMGQTGVQMLGYLGGITSDELNAHKSQGYQLGDLYGQSGLENQYERALRGTPGTKRVEVDAQGQVVGDLGQTQPSSGDDLVTNIDGGLEQTLQQALDSEIASLPGSSGGGAAVAIDPQTGAVLALASSPTYDPTWWEPEMTNAHYAQLSNPSSHYPLNDRAIDGLYIPGSTFKLATATAALNDGLITPGYYYDDTGRYTIPGCKTSGLGCATYTDNEGEIGGEVNVTKALTISSDIFFYNLGVTFWDDYKANGQYGETPIQDAANALGYGEVTGIDVPGETYDARVDSPQVVAREHAQNPVAYPNSGWFTGNNLELAFGQGGTVITPIEQAVAYATFANGGTRYTPEIAAGLVDPVTHRIVQRFAPKVAGHVSYSPADYQAMLNGFELRLPGISPFHLPSGGEDRHGHSPRATPAELVVRRLGPPAEPAVPDRRRRGGRRLRLPSSGSRCSQGFRLLGRPPRGADPAGCSVVDAVDLHLPALCAFFDNRNGHDDANGRRVHHGDDALHRPRQCLRRRTGRRRTGQQGTGQVRTSQNRRGALAGSLPSSFRQDGPTGWRRCGG